MIEKYCCWHGHYKIKNSYDWCPKCKQEADRPLNRVLAILGGFILILGPIAIIILLIIGIYQQYF